MLKRIILYHMSGPSSPFKILVRVLLALIIIIGGWAAYQLLWPNSHVQNENSYLYIPTGANYNEVLKEVEEGGFVRNKKSFDWIARRMQYPRMVKAGKYKIEKGMSNLALVRMLRNGRQEPVKLVINKVRTQRDLLRMLDEKLEPDSASFSRWLQNESFLDSFSLNPDGAMALILPDTYELYWNTTAQGALQKIGKNYLRFWTNERKELAQQKNLSIQQAITLASIVEEETTKKDEMGTIASVYLNRLAKGMKLQADPTARFAFGDFTIKRITSRQTSLASPYNTYFTSGLPPGPICTPSKSTIDAVLKAPDSDYLFFCAKDDFSGYHSFATNYSDHKENARRYQQALNERGIQ